MTRKEPLPGTPKGSQPSGRAGPADGSAGTCRPRRVVVVGGANVDIGGRASGKLIAGDSNPGRVRVSPGGVGRNIAHDLALLGVGTSLLTALGEDAGARWMVDTCTQAGIDLSHALHVRGAVTSTYLFIADAAGEMALALSEMEVCRHITPEYLAAQAEVLDGADAIVLDTNLPAESILWLAGHCKAPLFADPVSAVKADKLRPALGRLHTLKPNRLEAERLTGIPVRDDAGLNAAADALLAAGLRRVFITLGGEGVLAADQQGRCHLPCLPARAVSATGCGDAFMAALVWAQLRGLGRDAAARAGLTAAAIAMEGEGSINPLLSEEEIIARLRSSSTGGKQYATQPVS